MQWIPAMEVQFRIQSVIQQLLQQMILQEKECILHFQTKQRNLVQPSCTKTFVQTIVLLNRIHELLIHNKHITQRDVYYWCIDYFSSQIECNQMIQDVTHLLCFPRECLHIFTASKGMICGSIEYQQQDARYNIVAISSLPNTTLICDQKYTPAKYILLIEKDGIFQRLFEDRFHHLIPSILITACGYPDYATRNLVHQLYKILQIPVVCLVDYNPHGMDILMTYKSSLPCVQWLGIHSKDVTGLHSIPFTVHDEQYCHTVEQKLNHEFLKKEFQVMKQTKRKVELEALQDVKEYVKIKLLTREFHG